ncbi:MAG: hypothetical protein OEX22_11455 [Cyclobacteriaceae bacterium]|nr:hypothetical protein [Cyclobacteriaceae bacterium]
MPVANCYIKNGKVTQNEVHELASKWAKAIHVDAKDICITFIPDCIQGGQQYKILVNLYLPSLWSEKNIKNMQLSLFTILKNHFQYEKHEIFVITSIVQSGHVLEGGELIEW